MTVSGRFLQKLRHLRMSWPGLRQDSVPLLPNTEIETGDGEKRQWHAGEIFVADDTDGKHLTRVVEGPCRTLFVRLPPDFVIEQWSS